MRLIDANKIVYSWRIDADGQEHDGVTLQSIIDKMPTINPEPRKKGKWIYGEKSGQDGWYCSECGGFIPWYYDFYGLDNIDFIEEFKTCPFCDSKMVSYTGADMEEGEEG